MTATPVFGILNKYEFKAINRMIVFHFKLCFVFEDFTRFPE
jgi:hypothetical protein